MAKAFLYGNGGASGIDTTKVTATAADIITGKKAYLNDSGEPTSGTLPLVSPTIGDHLQSPATPVYGAYSGDRPSQNFMYTRLKNDGQPDVVAYSGINWVRTEASNVASTLGITAAKIVKGNVVCGVTGTADTDGGIINFPLTVSASQPSPIRSGHVWVNTTRVTSNPSGGVYVKDTITADLPNNSLIFIVDKMDKSNLGTWGKVNSTNAFLGWNNDAVTPWAAGYNLGKYELYLPYPLVYTKINGTIYIENAYVWDGSKWILVSNADKYFLGLDGGSGGSNYQRLIAANWIGDNLVYKDTSLGATSFGEPLSMSKNGKFMAKSLSGGYILEIYSRTGDTFKLFQTIHKDSLATYFSGTAPLIPNSVVFSADGSYMAFMTGNTSFSGTANRAKLFKFKLNLAGTAFELFSYQEFEYAGSPYNNNIAGSDDLSVIVVAFIFASTQYMNYVVIGTFTSTQTMVRYAVSTYYRKPVVSPNGLYGALVAENGYDSAALVIDYANAKVYATTFYADVAYRGHAGVLTNDGEYLGFRAVSQTNTIRVYHIQIVLSGTLVSYTQFADTYTYAAGLGITDTYFTASALSYSGDKNNAYLVAVGGSNSTYGNHLVLYKVNFSGGKYTSLTKLSETTMPYLLLYGVGYLIGGQ